ncbi:MAG: hypothetical protein MSH10_00255 [Pygmaiobacter massiliensis]|nr:hypothetical protein [Pygmaiobacter massiliensis]
MEAERFHLHPLQYAGLIRYALALCLVPAVNALLDLDLHAVRLALGQSAGILCGFILLGYFLWRFGTVSIVPGAVIADRGVLFSRSVFYMRSQLSAVQLRRTLLCRLLGASQVTLYFKSEHPVPSVQLTLPRTRARQLADELMPARDTHTVFEPGGFDRLLFVALSANILATCALSVLTVWRLTRFENNRLMHLQAAAEAGFVRTEQLVAAILPAGLSMLVTLMFYLGVLSLLRSFLSTAGFSLRRCQGVLITRSGFFTHTERRILIACVNSSSVHLTLWARLLHRWPVYLTAGGFHGRELPLVVIRPADAEFQLRRFLPEFTLPRQRLCNPRRRKPTSFLWKCGAAAALTLALCGVSLWALPGLTWLLALAFVFALVWCLAHLEAFFTEGVCKNENRTFTVQYTRGFTRYLVSVYTNDLAFRLRQNPIAANEGRCNLSIYTPSRTTLRVRSVEYTLANRLQFNM